MEASEEIIKQEPIYLNGWKCKYDVVSGFGDTNMDYEDFISEEPTWPNKKNWHKYKADMEKELEEFKDVNIILASYGNDYYEGEAFVLFEREGRLFEVNASHCSCYGLEGQWNEEVEEVVLEELKNRLKNGTFGECEYTGNNFKKELCALLGVEYVKNK